MFGNMIPDVKALSKEDKRIYRGYYCGLCENLRRLCGQRGRFLLTFELTFLTLLESGLNEPAEILTACRCPRHPAKKQTVITTPYTAYAADMNLLLAYRKACDDEQDGDTGYSKAAHFLLKKAYPLAAARRPAEDKAIESILKDLYAIEQNDERNPDIPANCFGTLTALLFPDREDTKAFGFELGKLIYLLDAVRDLHHDLKHCQYNPMVSIASSSFQQILTNQWAECTRIYDTIPLKRYQSILDNLVRNGLLRQIEGSAP